MAAINWEELGVELLEREHRPVLVVDAHQQVLRANRGFLALVPDGTPVVGAPSSALWLPTAADAWTRALAQARAGARPRLTLALARADANYDPVLELMALGTRPDAAVLAVMVDAVPRQPTTPLRQAHGQTYEVALEPDGQPGRLVRRAVAGEAHVVPGDGRPCYAVLHGRTEPCERCALRPTDAGGPGLVVVPGTGPQFEVTVRVGRPSGQGLATVTEFDLGPDAWSALVTARIDHLAGTAQLGLREREMLRLLLLGRSLDEVALATGLSPRNAKYHKENLFRKVGAESRADLFRLVM